jgi:8-oxo-dGTP pyrophosphatase MutT (NUDIX family)
MVWNRRMGRGGRSGHEQFGRGIVRRRRPPEERSAGGVVLRGEETLVVVPTRRSASGARVLALPKGHLDAGETAEQAAQREVREEGGVDAELIERLGEVRYRYRRDGRVISKSVHFFLFAFRGGSTDDHDHEIEEARWMDLARAATELSYAGEREMASRALSKIRPDR